MRFPGTGVVSGMAEKFFRDAGVGSLAYKAIVLRGKPLWEYGRVPRGGSGDLCGKKDSAGLAGGARFAGAPAGNMRTARHDRMEKTSPFPGSGAFFGNGVGFWHGGEVFSGALAMPGFDCSAGTYVGAFGGQVRFGGSGRGGGGWGALVMGDRPGGGWAASERRQSLQTQKLPRSKRNQRQFSLPASAALAACGHLRPGKFPWP